MSSRSNGLLAHVIVFCRTLISFETFVASNTGVTVMNTTVLGSAAFAVIARAVVLGDNEAHSNYL